jgi:hypothetical protein
LLRPSFGFCKVRLVSGEEGYVANEDIAEAAGELIAANTPQRTPLRGAVPQPRSVLPSEPLPELEPTPFPEPPNSGD